MKDVREYVQYFRFVPAPHNSQGGVLCTPWMGEVAAGRIYPVYDAMRVGILKDHDEWEAVSKKDFDAQTKDDQKEQDDEE